MNQEEGREESKVRRISEARARKAAAEAAAEAKLAAATSDAAPSAADARRQAKARAFAERSASAREAREARFSALEPWEAELYAKLLVDTQTMADGSEVTSIRSTSANVSTILQCHEAWRGVLAWNLFHLRLETTRTPPWHELDAGADSKAGEWGDADSVRLVHWLERTPICGLAPLHVPTRLVQDAVLVAGEANAFHPVRDYFAGLVWDGAPRLESLASAYFGGEDTPYARAVSSSLLVSAVARVTEPGCKVDTMVVLEGHQGAGKSSALAVLAGPWFGDSKLPIGDKDSFQLLPGKLFWEIGELSGLTKADVEDVKAYLSSAHDRYRQSYGKYARDVPRQTVFVGTTNAETYLKDATGGRRFYPLKTGAIDLEALRRDRDQLWAEAIHVYATTRRWWLDDELARGEQAARFVQDEWQAKIGAWLVGRPSVTVGEILEGLIFAERERVGWGEADHGALKNSISRWGQREQNRVSGCLTALGWARRRVRTGAVLEWRYFPKAGS